MTIEITNSPYVGQNPVEAFISELIADAQHCNPAKPWKRIPPDENSAQEGFKLADSRGCETFLQIDSMDTDHMQLSLRCISSDGTSVMTSTEWSIEDSPDNPLRALYALLDQSIPSLIVGMNPSREEERKLYLPLMEQLIDCLTVDAAKLHTINWKATPSALGLPSYCAEGRAGNGTVFRIVPEELDEASDAITFTYEINGDEVMSVTQRAPREAHSPLRELYQAVAKHDTPSGMNVIGKYVASTREQQYLSRILRDGADPNPAVLIGDIFRECNAGSVTKQYVEEICKRQPNLRSNPDELKRIRVLSISVIEVLRRTKRQPNGCIFTSRVVEVSKKDNLPTRIRFSSSSLAHIANAECTYMAEFFVGVPRKHAANRAAVMILAAILRDY